MNIAVSLTNQVRHSRGNPRHDEAREQRISHSPETTGAAAVACTGLFSDSRTYQKSCRPTLKKVFRNLLQGAQRLLVLQPEGVHTRHIELAIALKMCPCILL